MTKLNQIKVGMLAMAIVLMSVVLSVAQTANPGPATGAQSIKPKHPAATELKTFKSDPSNPELSELRHSLLKAKAELEAGNENNSFTQDQINMYTRRIGLLESKIQSMSDVKAGNDQVSARDVQRKAVTRDAVMVELKATNKITRAQFAALEPADQKFAIMNNVTITDLVNATTESLRTRDDNKFYIAAAAFRSFDVEKQIHILNNPSTYIITTEEVAVPTFNNVNGNNELKKHTISRSELNTYSPEKRKAIENSSDFVITD